MAGNLLKKEVTAAHVADAFVALALGNGPPAMSSPSTAGTSRLRCGEAAVGPPFPPSPLSFISACDRP